MFIYQKMLLVPHLVCPRTFLASENRQHGEVVEAEEIEGLHLLEEKMDW